MPKLAMVRFGVFQLDGAEGELRRQGRRVHLAAKPLKVLALLTARAGEVVTRQELRNHLWGNDTFVEFDRALNFASAEVRAALRDQARSPRFIETLPKRGYRFIADVHYDAPAVDAATVATMVHRPWRAAAMLAAATIALCIQQPIHARAHTRRDAAPAALAQFERALAAPGDAESLTALRVATGIDPRFAEAHYMLAHYLWDFGLRRELPMRTAANEARLAADRAIALEDVAQSRRLLGTIRLVADWDWPGARDEMTRAVALKPQWDLGQALYARLLSASGDDTAAIAAIDRAASISPASEFVQFEAGEVYARAGRYDEALERLDRALQYGPPRGWPEADWITKVRARQFMILLIQGRPAAAHRTAAIIVNLSGVSREVQERFARNNSADAIRNFLARSVEISTTPTRGAIVRATYVAALESLRGNTDAALGWLEQAAWEHDPDLVWVLRNPEFNSLRELPRFRALDARVRRGVTRG